IWLLGTPLQRRMRKLSRRWPCSSSLITTYATELLPAPFIFLIYCPRFASRFARDTEPSDRSPSRQWRDRQTAGHQVFPAPIAQARPTQNDWLSSLTKSSDVNG